MDSQSVKGADTVGHDSRGYDANKKINGRKRFIMTDTLGLLLVVCVMAASVQDRDGAKTTLLSLIYSPRSDTCSPMRGSPGCWWSGPSGCCGPRCTLWVKPQARSGSR
ncbi:transposase [Nonomuraea sp. NPDC048826]|uniref:transposase n=1 Tax=Nonomuraea sp. NPDC048826 TaxID=3364347 RepID=UPI00371A76F6